MAFLRVSFSQRNQGGFSFPPSQAVLCYFLNCFRRPCDLVLGESAWVGLVGLLASCFATFNADARSPRVETGPACWGPRSRSQSPAGSRPAPRAVPFLRPVSTRCFPGAFSLGFAQPRELPRPRESCAFRVCPRADAWFLRPYSGHSGSSVCAPRYLQNLATKICIHV